MSESNWTRRRFLAGLGCTTLGATPLLGTLVNLGGATAADVLWLMAETRRRVRDLHGVELEPEICLWGFEPDEMSQVGAAS